jgi:hypothetical protein
MITVRVYYESSDEPAIGKIVSLGVDGLFRTDSQVTDIDGEVLFNVEPCEGRVFVNGSIAYKGYLKERIVVYV